MKNLTVTLSLENKKKVGKNSWNLSTKKYMNLEQRTAAKS